MFSILFVYFLSIIVSLFVSSCSSAPTPSHVIVLMEENRSFDHILGFLKRNNSEIRGLTGNEYNPLSNGTKVYVNDKAKYIVEYDPDHSIGGTSFEIFDSKDSTKYTYPPPMDGFAEHHLELKKDPQVVLKMFPPERVPIISTLATEFALFDTFFASVPGPTDPNRQYCHSGTSHGFVDNSVPTDGWVQETIYDKLVEAGKTFKVYYWDVVDVLNFKNLRKDDMKKYVQPIENFWADCKSGNLPNYVFLNPRWVPTETLPANDQHPVHTVEAGEEYMKEVYEAVRASPKWNETLLLVTYDEHGGFYDHFPTPMKNVPNPDGIKGPNGFNFDRLGVRIPMIAISPYIPKGTLVHEPENPPTPDSQYNLASVPATLHKIFKTNGFLTKRDEWSPTLDSVMTLDSPRDCPEKLPVAVSLSKRHIEQEGNAPLSDLQLDFCQKTLPYISGKDFDCESMTQLEYGKLAKAEVDAFLKR